MVLWQSRSRKDVFIVSPVFRPLGADASVDCNRSTIIDALERHTHAADGILLYFYFDYTEQNIQTPSNILATLLHQLLSRLPTLPDQASNLSERIKQNRPLPSWGEMIQIFISVTDAQTTQVYLVMDALDECDANRNRPRVLDLLDYAFNQSKIRTLVTSRPYPADIKAAFAAYPEIVIEASEADIKTFLAEKIASRQGSMLLRSDDPLRQEIIDTLAAKSQGVYVIFGSYILR